MKRLFSISLTLIAVWGLCTPLWGASRTVQTVEPVKVHVPVGCVPQLPYRLWVTYSDGKSEFRQVRWENYELAVEWEQSNPQIYGVGAKYTVQGFLLGDTTTPQGYPVTAQVEVVAPSRVGGTELGAGQAPHILAEPVPLDRVRILGDNRLTSNRDLAVRAICSWDVSQQLYNYRDTYHLSTQGYTMSDGWDSPTTKLKGHGSGHYMSALAQAYAVTENNAQKDTLLRNITRMVDELRACQELTFVWNDSLGRYWEARDLVPQEEMESLGGSWDDFDRYKQHPEKYGYGYINAIPAQHAVLIEKYCPYNNTTGVWAPYYSIHKQLAGLIDIATYVDQPEVAQKALIVAKDMGLWVWNRLHYRTFVDTTGTVASRRSRPGNRYEMWNMYIAGEVGGIGESLARLAEMVSDPLAQEHLKEASNAFDSPAFFEPLKRNRDDIRTRHANQHIPMIIAALRSYRINGDAGYYRLAQNFWHLIQGRYRYATGGVGNQEMFREPYTQILSLATNGVGSGEGVANGELNETCCVYNLLKLTRDLNSYDPNNAAYMDYYERTLYNQVVGSLHPEHYGTTYHYAMGVNASKSFENHTPHITCCGGTGSENHTKYQEATYYVNDHTLWVTLYMPTEMEWREKGLTLQQQCAWPANHSRLVITKGKASFTLKLRVPYWATNGFTVKVNGRKVRTPAHPGTYLTLKKRHWRVGDVVEMDMPFTKHLDFGPDKLPAALAAAQGAPAQDAWVATLMYGPLAMTAGDVENWNEAALQVSDDLSEVEAHQPERASKGTNGHIFTLSMGSRTFLPDYYRQEHSTHYLRVGSDALVTPVDLDYEVQRLRALVQTAQERVARQEAWKAEEREDTTGPWAPFGYGRMEQALQKGEGFLMALDTVDRVYAERKVASTVTTLQTALHTMRPGHLAEPEALYPLEGLLRRAGRVTEQTPRALREAVEYALMVKQYVLSGSGTPDMIRTAVSRLRTAME